MPTYTSPCPGCKADQEFDIEPFTEGRTSGPPELCYPSEGGYAEQQEDCPCGYELTDENLQQIYNQWEQEQPQELDPDYEPEEPTYEEDLTPTWPKRSR